MTPTVVIPMLSLGGSGGVRVVCALANGLAAKGVAVRIIAPSYAAIAPIPLDPGVVLDVVEMNKRGRLSYMRRVIGRLRGARGVAVSTGYMTPLLIHVARAAGAKLTLFSLIQGYEPVTHIRHGSQPAWTKPVLHLIARLGYRLPGYKVAVSRYVSDKVGARRVDEVIHPGIRAEFVSSGVLPQERARLRIGTLPAAAESKGTRFAAAAFEALTNENASMEFVMFDAEQSILDFYRDCDVFVFPSLVEGFGLPPLEAMACGSVVVLSDCGGVREYAVHEKNCLIVPPGDGTRIADALRRLAADSELRARLREKGFETAARFPEAAFVDACSAAIVRLLR